MKIPTAKPLLCLGLGTTLLLTPLLATPPAYSQEKASVQQREEKDSTLHWDIESYRQTLESLAQSQSKPLDLGLLYRLSLVHLVDQIQPKQKDLALTLLNTPLSEPQYPSKILGRLKLLTLDYSDKERDQLFQKVMEATCHDLADHNHTRLLTKDRWKELQKEARYQQQIGKLGITFEVQEDGLLIHEVPSDFISIEGPIPQKGDLLLAIEETPVQNLATQELRELVNGPLAQALLLQLQNQEGKKYTTTALRRWQPKQLQAIESDKKAPQEILHLHLPTLTPDHLSELKTQIAKKDQQGWILLDLRKTQSSVPQGLEAASIFLPPDSWLGWNHHQENKKLIRSDRSQKGDTQSKLCLLLGPQSSASSLLMAAILQDHGRAMIAGAPPSPQESPTAVLNIIEQPMDQVLLFHHTRYSSPRGQELWHQPLRPDLPIKLTSSKKGVNELYDILKRLDS